MSDGIEWLTVAEAAERRGVGENTILRSIQVGKLPVRKEPRPGCEKQSRFLVKASDLAALPPVLKRGPVPIDPATFAKLWHEGIPIEQIADTFKTSPNRIRPLAVEFGIHDSPERAAAQALRLEDRGRRCAVYLRDHEREKRENGLT